MIQFILFTGNGVQTLNLGGDSPKAKELLATGKIRGGTVVLDLRAESGEVVTPHNLTAKQIDYLSRRVESLNLSKRAKNCLEHAGYVWIWELCDSSEAEILKIRNAGDKTLNEIKVELDVNGDGLELNSSTRIDSVRHLLPESVSALTEAQIDVLRQNVEETSLPESVKTHLREAALVRIWMVCEKRPVDIYNRMIPRERHALHNFLLARNLRTGIGPQIDRFRDRFVIP